MDVDINTDDENYARDEDSHLLHVLLPRVLPQTKGDLYKTEHDLLNQMVESVRGLSKWLPAKTNKLFQSMKKVHATRTPEIVAQEINALEPGDTFAMFVRFQHCTIMIHIPDNEQPGHIQNAVVCTIAGSLHPDEVYKHDSDIEFNYPQQAIKIKFSKMLKSTDFTNQLCVLFEGLPIESQNRDCVHKWLVALLMDENSVEAVNIPVITKKIRDELLGESNTNYFRRSSFYMSNKALLQLSLTIHKGEEMGKLLYKIVMLQFLCDVCAPYKNYTSSNIDLLSQMIAKLARRIEKLVLPEKTPAEIVDLHKTTVDKTKETIKVIRGKIDEQIQRIHENFEKNVRLPHLTGLDLSSDIHHKMSKLRKYLNERSEWEPKIKISKHDIDTYGRYFFGNLPNVEVVNNLAQKDPLERRIFWLEFENFVLYKMQLADNRWTVNELHGWTLEYANYAEDHYKNNQLFISQMLLVRLKLIAMLDGMAIQKHPLLKQHHSGINPKIINSLLLPRASDMRIAHELQMYFCERNGNAEDPTIGESSISENSFSVKYAAKDRDMEQLREEILKDDAKNIEGKKREWKADRERVEKLKNQANRLKCAYFVNSRGYDEHSFNCEKCALQSAAAQIKIEQYEHLLPDDASAQYAIVFELKIPVEIAFLRDVLYGFAKFCCGDGEPLNIKENWTKRLAHYNKSENIIRRVKLGRQIKQKLHSYHVDCSFDTFVVSSNFPSMFHAYDLPIISTLADDCIKTVCTFKTSDEYVNMQWTLNSTSHTENEVLTSQSKCHPDLTLSEYKNFGSLRADGNRLQLRKLYAIIETEALSFEKDSVLALILQTLWECEESGQSGVIRESHIDFVDTNFCSAMIELLNKFVEIQRNNWMRPFKLLMAILITVRAFEINKQHSLASEITRLVHQIREIVLDWINKIEEAIHEMPSGSDSDKTGRDLRLKLITTAIIGGLTFYVDPDHTSYNEIFNASALQSWLKFVVTLNNNIRMYTNDENQLPSTLQMFIRLVEKIGVDMEPRATALVGENDDAVYCLIRQQWPRAKQAAFSTIQFRSDFPQIIQTTVVGSGQTVTIDMITGSFLVDGMPLSRLPSSIMLSEVYRWFFGNVVFEVQSETQCRFSTKREYNCDDIKVSYDFEMINNQVIITERSTEFEKELVDYNIFKGEFPIYLIEKYSHWWNKTKNCVEFRRRADNKKHFSKETDVDYCLDLEHQHLIHQPTQRRLLDINSGSFAKIVAQLSRLEHSKYIHVLTDSVCSGTTQLKKSADVELVRMNLKFLVERSEADGGHIDLISNEFSGMRVSQNQSVGALYGLEHGLVLESASNNGQMKMLLIPNGPISVNCRGIHTSASINTEGKLHIPTFYQYQVNDICWQLKASNGTDAAWFYLAYLHAITSHGEIEPFTGMSGTERAIQILQSAFVWSSSPYELEALKNLNAIAQLTPLRKLKDGRQTVTWPHGISQRSAQDSFVFITAKLIKDSQRLAALYPLTEERKGERENIVKTMTLKTDLKLNERDHWRCQPFNPNLQVCHEFMPNKMLRTSMSNCKPIRFAENTRTICNLYHKQQYLVPNNLELKRFLTSSEKLIGIAHKANIRSLLIHNERETFRNLWISLYEAARKRLGENELTLEQLAIVFSFFAHHGENVIPIYALQAVAMNPKQFEQINPPNVKCFTIANFNEKQIRDLLNGHYETPEQYYTKKWADSGEKVRHDAQLKLALDGIVADITRNWPSPSYDFASKWSCKFGYFDYTTAGQEMNDLLKIWYNKYLLDAFIDAVEIRLKALPLSGSKSVPFSLREQPIAKNWMKHTLNFEAKLCDNLDRFQEVVEEAQEIWNLSTNQLNRSANDWLREYMRISNTENTNHLIVAGIFPRLVPSWILPKIADVKTNDRLKYVIGAWAIAITHQQRQSRMHPHCPQQRNLIQLEYMPCEYPEWLLFEIEQNITIRSIQIEIAQRMIDPPKCKDSKHSVMQLNMGEGKTSVIVPIVAAKLANQDHLCQVTVLKSLFTTNLKTLRQCLGGFVGRKIYTIPCRRDLPKISTIPCRRDLSIEDNIAKILETYKECKEIRGVIFTLPEYRLSFQLKIYEAVQKQKFDISRHLLQVYKWTNENIRNILDESDAILHPKYQLIYTIGTQSAPDGNSQRWLVTQAVLKRVPFIMHRLYQKHGELKIEFDENYVRHRKVFGAPMVDHRNDVFTPCRILDDTGDIFEALKTEIINSFVEGELDVSLTGINEDRKEKLRELLMKRILEPERFHVIISDFSEEQASKILILSGLLRCEILKLALTKRWRVSYGVKENHRRKMAIPFKAKDVAAEMTEFGHADVAVCLTQLSCYYSGLTDAQLYQVFTILDKLQDASAIYGKWIESISSALITASIQSYQGVNLDDPKQRDELLFPLLRKNMYVIDFWLSNWVFPKELKVFEGKLMCTAWDLCGEQLEHEVTGFSGTNDTKDILPMPIAQNDLEKLEDTNARMRETLLHQRNRPYKKLPANVSGSQILDDLVRLGIPVLLDSGALMLELNNKEVALTWVKLAPSQYEAAVYFDETDTLQTIDRLGLVTQFDYSVYRDNLSRCVAYLDDVHTRGTDLKFPPNWKACVTLSGDITRDKTVQSCMRMRQLETTQSISFWASHEADLRIRKVCNLTAEADVMNEHVIQFIEHNSSQFIENNMVHWTTASINYTKKLIGYQLYGNATEPDESLTKLYNKCVDKELVKLKEMYGGKKEVPLKKVAWDKFSSLMYDDDDDDDEDDEFKKKIQKIQNFVNKKLKSHAQTKLTHAFDEEQEKELEQEEENQSQVERPPDAISFKPFFEQRLQDLVTNGYTKDELATTKSYLLSIPPSLSHTQFYKDYESEGNAWADHLLVTKDFQMITKNASSMCDEFLRTVRWVARIKSRTESGDYILVLLSTFECNHLLPAFRKSKCATLFAYRPRLSQSHSNLIHNVKLQVSGISPNDNENCISIDDAVQIGVYSGLMYFNNEPEQNAYCGFLGLIPQPRIGELKTAFEDNIIDKHGFVPKKRRRYSEAISNCVGQCQFNGNPSSLAIKFIEAHHQMLPEVSHAASILIYGKKNDFNAMETE